MKVFYPLGRGLQIVALLGLPPAIWVGQFGRSMMGEVAILGGAIVIFLVGTFLARASSK